MQPLALGAVSTPPSGAPRKWGRKGRNKSCISITFNSSASSGKTRRSGKSAATARISPCCPLRPSSRGKTRTTSGRPEPSGTRVVAFNRLDDSIADTLHTGDHVLIDGQLVSSKYESENGKSKKAKGAKVTIFWRVRANSVRRLSRAEAEVPAAA